MKFDVGRYHRRSIRLDGYDYRQAGAYFVTICTQDRECLLGQISNGEVTTTPAGDMVQTVWDALPQHYPGVDIDAFVVMPNHVHGIIVLTGQPAQAALSLPDVVHRLKSLTTTHYRRGVLEQKWLPFAGRLWHRNYYEHIVRNDDDLERIREYIVQNPARWLDDENNPTRL
jgi:putative transposase